MKQVFLILIAALSLQTSNAWAELDSDRSTMFCSQNPSKCREFANPSISIGDVKYAIAWSRDDHYFPAGIMHTFCIGKGFKGGYAQFTTAEVKNHQLVFSSKSNVNTGALSEWEHQYINKVVCSPKN